MPPANRRPMRQHILAHPQRGGPGPTTDLDVVDGPPADRTPARIRGAPSEPAIIHGCSPDVGVLLCYTSRELRPLGLVDFFIDPSLTN